MTTIVFFYCISELFLSIFVLNISLYKYITLNYRGSWKIKSESKKYCGLKIVIKVKSLVDSAVIYCWIRFNKSQ